MSTCLYPHHDERDTHEAKVGLLCQSGYDRLEQTVAELPALVGWLHANIAAGGSGQHNEAKRTKGEPPIPIRDTVHDHIVEIRGVLTSWVQLVAEERQLIGPDNTDPTVTATYLTAHLPWAAQQLWIDDFATEILDLSRVGHGLAPSRPRHYRLPAPCPSCDALELHRQDGDDYVSCSSCGRLWTEAEYVRLVVVLAGEVDLPEWVPVAVVAVRFGINPATVWKWKQRGLLQARRDGCQVLVRLVCDIPTTAQEGAA
jgi:hypothetical protein